MHFVSDSSLKRPDYEYETLPGGGFIGYPVGRNDPVVNWKHVDGPLLYLSNGRIHWLTFRERIKLFFGLTTIEKIDANHAATGRGW